MLDAHGDDCVLWQGAATVRKPSQSSCRLPRKWRTILRWVESYQNLISTWAYWGRQWCGIIHYHWWTASIKPRLLFSRAGYASWGLSLSSVYYCFTINVHYYAKPSVYFLVMMFCNGWYFVSASVISCFINTD